MSKGAERRRPVSKQMRSARLHVHADTHTQLTVQAGGPAMSNRIIAVK